MLRDGGLLRLPAAAECEQLRGAVRGAAGEDDQEPATHAARAWGQPSHHHYTVIFCSVTCDTTNVDNEV